MGSDSVTYEIMLHICCSELRVIEEQKYCPYNDTQLSISQHALQLVDNQFQA